ncbi:MAG TPA: DinB family protein [Candidatus Angelobacter sp.]|nr:DinB family protein [Candidatus Angelobacter sp.]
MKHLRALFLLAVLTFAVGAYAQGGSHPAAASPTPQAQKAPAGPSSLAEIVDRQVSQYEKNVVGVAEAMPEDKFNFSPSSLNIPNAEYKDVRTFAQLITHTAAANFYFWTTVTGEKMPENIKGPNGPEFKTKAEAIQFLKDSFAVGHRAAKTLTAENAGDQLPFFRGTQARLFIASGAVIHDADEYGQMVEYLRMNGIVPPASRH